MRKEMLHLKYQPFSKAGKVSIHTIMARKQFMNIDNHKLVNGMKLVWKKKLISKTNWWQIRAG